MPNSLSSLFYEYISLCKANMHLRWSFDCKYRRNGRRKKKKGKAGEGKEGKGRCELYFQVRRNKMNFSIFLLFPSPDLIFIQGKSQLSLSLYKDTVVCSYGLRKPHTLSKNTNDLPILHFRSTLTNHVQNPWLAR